MSDSEFSFPLDDNGCIPETAKFRVLCNGLVYGDLAPLEMQGQRFAKKGDVITIYEEIRRYPDRVQLLVRDRHIEFVPPPQEFKPRVKRYASDKEVNDSVNMGSDPQKEIE